jgi:hypothetical protein
MSIKDLLVQIGAEIARLKEARALLAVGAGSEIRGGRPKKSPVATVPTKPAKKKRNLSPEGRARISAAVKRRWAALKG